MPEIEHNAPKFQYRVSWKRDLPGEAWTSHSMNDWKQSSHVVNNLKTFEKFVIKVVALNEKGESNVAPKEVVGYSGEDGKMAKLFSVVSSPQDRSQFRAIKPVSSKFNVNGSFR